MDRIDSRILQLLQQRTKLSGRIGETKRRHGVVVYVPERERELLARVTALGGKKLPVRAVAAIYREILSGSRAAQGQMPIGLLRASAQAITLPGRRHFGACDEFLPKKTWGEIATDLKKGVLALALLRGDDLSHVMGTPKGRREFSKHFTVVGDFSSTLDPKVSLDQRVFIVTPRGKEVVVGVNRILILIECKSTVNAVKSLLNSMPSHPIHVEHLTFCAPSARGGGGAMLVRLALARPIDGARAMNQLLVTGQLAGFPVSILGVYPGTENYGG